MKTAGQILRARREEFAMSTKEVAESIKVREKYVLALEADDYKNFSSVVYLKGFLKNYAKFLGLDPEHIVATYRRDSEMKADTVRAVGSEDIVKSPIVITPQIIISILVVVFVLSIIGYFVNQFYLLNKPPVLTIETPKDGATLTTEMATIKGETVPDADLTINGDPVKVDSKGVFKTTLALEEGENTIIIKSKDSSNIGTEAEKKIQIFYKKPEAEAPPVVVPDSTDNSDDDDNPPVANPTTNKDEMAVLVEITGENAWIELTIDGKKSVARIVNAGGKVELTAKESVLLVTGKMSSTKLSINGTAQSFTGQRGVGRLSCELDSSEDAGFICKLPE